VNDNLLKKLQRCELLFKFKTIHRLITFNSKIFNLNLRAAYNLISFIASIEWPNFSWKLTNFLAQDERRREKTEIREKFIFSSSFFLLINTSNLPFDDDIAFYISRKSISYMCHALSLTHSFSLTHLHEFAVCKKENWHNHIDRASWKACFGISLSTHAA
jgi:hypothetical protein